MINVTVRQVNTWASGNKYVGEWRDDKRSGQGTYTHADGRVERGVWKTAL